MEVDATSDPHQPALEELVFTLHDRCPSWCQYCFNAKNVPTSLSRGTFNLSNAALEPESVVQIIQEALPLGLQSLQLSGGEPLVRLEAVATIARFASSRAIPVTLYTNGYLINEHVAGELADAGITGARISLGGSSYEEHSRFRSDPAGLRSWEAICAAFGLLRDAGIPASALIPVIRSGLTDLRASISTALGLGAEKVVLHRYISSGLTVQDRLFDLTVDEHMQAIETILEIRESLGEEKVILDYGFFEFLSPHWRSGDPVKRCKCGRNRLGIMANGRISTCCCSSIDLGNMHSGPSVLSRIWRGHRVLSALRHSTPLAPCAECKWWTICQGACPSFSLMQDEYPSLPDACPVVATYKSACETRDTKSAAREALDQFDARVVTTSIGV